MAPSPISSPEPEEDVWFSEEPHRDERDWADIAAEGIFRDGETTNEPTPQPGNGRADATLSRPPRRLVITNLHQAERAAAIWKEVLARNNPPVIFRQGEKLVRIVRDDRGQVSILRIDEAWLSAYVARCVHFLKNTSKGEIASNVPKNAIEDMLARPDERVPTLRGIAEVPQFLPGGTLCTEPGYDPSSKIFLEVPPNLRNLRISPWPSEEEVARAKARIINELLEEFPFADQADRANAIALLLLPLVRLMIQGPVPLHMIDAPTRGTGKTLLAQCLMVPSVPGDLPMMPETRDDNEMRKRITAVLLSGRPVVCLDNLQGKLWFSSLAAVLTSNSWGDRVLSKSEAIDVEAKTIWIATANNPSFSEDILRRTVSIRLDPGSENPEAGRKFKRRLPTWAREHREELLAAALTIIQAWIAEGQPEGDEHLATYEAYASVMGGILKVAGVPGFLGNLHRRKEMTDGEASLHGALIELWAEEYQARAVSARELYSLIQDTEIADGLLNGKEGPGARAAFGQLLARLKDRVIGGYTVRAAGKDTNRKVPLYRLEPRKKVSE